MLANLFLAFILIAIAICGLLTLGQTVDWGTRLFRLALRFTRRSRLLTEYLLRAYLRYRKNINRDLILNS